MHKIFKIILIIFSVAGIHSLSTAQEKSDFETPSYRYVPNEAFGLGEKLEYDVGYKFITAGTGYFHILPEPVVIDGRKCYDIRFEVRSLPALDMLYRVKDAYRTVIDIGGIFPYLFEQHIREGKYKRDMYADFDQQNHKAYTRNKKKTDTFDIPPYVHDIVSALFYVRTMDLKNIPKDSTIMLKNFYKDSTYQLGVKIRGRQTIEVKAGEFKCVVVEPMVVKGGLFKSEGKILVWLTDDDRKIPVKVATKILIGYVGAELTKYSGVRGKVDAKIRDN